MTRKFAATTKVFPVDMELPLDLAEHGLPDIKEIASHLHFSPAEGEIRLDDRRMLLVHNSAFAALRREIVETVGEEKARGVFTRMGYASGNKDADLVRRSHPEVGPTRALAAGPQFHGFLGFIAVEIVTLELDIETGHFLGEFLWKNSAEAEEHLASIGLSNTPVCWLAQGYANGYISSFLGKQALIREVECRAMGHACCRIVGKTLDKWDNPEKDFQYLQAQGFVQSPWNSRFHSDESQPEAQSIASSMNIVGISPGFNSVCNMIQRVAPTRATVLFLGESGVGKEQFARTLHNVSDRKDKPFVAINCAAIPEQLIESELFGVEKGGYSGATQSRPGRFERADGGTLFLDEIGTLSLIAQGKLLRALQEGEIERIGDTKVRKVNVRVITATNEDLRDLVEARQFRHDLYYRLNVFPILIPPLRERREDILLLVEHFLNRYSKLHSRKITGLTKTAIDALLYYRWPGNIRELENIIERGVILAPEEGVIDVSHLFTSGEVLRPELLPEPKRAGSPYLGRETGQLPVNPNDLQEILRTCLAERSLSMDSLEEIAVRQAIELAQGNVSAAAKILGTTRARVAYRLEGRKVTRSVSSS